MRTRSHFYGVFVLLMVEGALLAGCVPGGGPPTVAPSAAPTGIPTIGVGAVPQYAGQTVILEGCLAFICPEMIGAEYPQDCLASVCDRDGDCINDMQFDEGKAHLRDLLEGYYEASLDGCVPLEVQGRVIELACPGCTTVYDLEVVDLSVGP